MKPALLAVAALAVSGCGPILFAEIEQPTICASGDGIEVPALEVPEPIALTKEDAITNPVLDTDAADVTIQIEHIVITTDDPNVDFTTAVTAAWAKVLPPDGSSLPAKTVAQARVIDAHRLEITGDAVNVREYVQGGKLKYGYDVEVNPPAQSWKANVEACLSVKAKVDYLGALL